MRTEHLATLLAVKRLGGVTPASAEAGVAQSTVTRQVRALEKELGVSLLERHAGRSAVLTPAGEALAAASPPLLAAADAAAAVCG